MGPYKLEELTAFYEGISVDTVTDAKNSAFGAPLVEESGNVVTLSWKFVEIRGGGMWRRLRGEAGNRSRVMKIVITMLRVGNDKWSINKEMVFTSGTRKAI